MLLYNNYSHGQNVFTLLWRTVTVIQYEKQATIHNEMKTDASKTPESWPKLSGFKSRFKFLPKRSEVWSSKRYKVRRWWTTKLTSLTEHISATALRNKKNGITHLGRCFMSYEQAIMCSFGHRNCHTHFSWDWSLWTTARLLNLTKHQWYPQCYDWICLVTLQW